jgi:hypothetical protein
MSDTGITTYIGVAGSKIPPLNWRRIFLAGLAFVILLAVLALSGEIFEHLDADQIMVIQAPLLVQHQARPGRSRISQFNSDSMTVVMRI